MYQVSLQACFKTHCKLILLKNYAYRWWMELTSRTFLFSLHSALTPLPLVQISLGPCKTWQIKTEQIAPTLDPGSSMVFVSILNLHLMGGSDTENFQPLHCVLANTSNKPKWTGTCAPFGKSKFYSRTFHACLKRITKKKLVHFVKLHNIFFFS